MENLNSCCFIATIYEIKEIPGADKIVQATIEGWSSIVQKGMYKQGDFVMVATTDAVIPEKLAEDMNVTGYLRKGSRVRTVKLRGVYSECLIIPLTFAKGITPSEGKDMMDIMGIFKYEPPVKQIQLASGKKIRYQENPNFLVYYKFPNAKNVKGIFVETDPVQITRKIHGTNARYGIVLKNKLSFKDRMKKWLWKTIKHAPDQWEWIDYEFVVGSHNVEKGSDSQGFYSTNVWYEIADKYKIKEKLWEHVKRYGVGELKSGIVLYGEIYGSGIQVNYDYGLKGIEFAAFDIMEDGTYLGTADAETVISSMLRLPHVPVLYDGYWSQEIQDKFVLNNFIEGTKVPHEGVVIKHSSGERSKIVKVINPDYLIYGEKHDVGDSH